MLTERLMTFQLADRRVAAAALMRRCDPFRTIAWLVLNHHGVNKRLDGGFSPAESVPAFPNLPTFAGIGESPISTVAAWHVQQRGRPWRVALSGQPAHERI
jgi:hypothetical protein